MITQIYGLTTVADAAGVDELSPDHIGIVVDEGVDTWDSVDETTALEIRGSVKNARVVALSLSNEIERIKRTVALLTPAIVHLVRAQEMTSEDLERLRESIDPVQLMLTVPITTTGSFTVASRLADVGDYLLLDTRHPDSGVVGASGLVHDWSISARVVSQVACPVILAGGLGPDNVVEAIRQVRPAGVDSETHTSCHEDRRRKDLHKVEAFLSLAREA